MDPNENLRQQNVLADRINAQRDRGEHIDEHDAMRLAELVLALNEWIVGGGFLPSVWAHVR